MSIFFTADTHFGHRFLAGLRTFPSVEEMDQHIIDQWNKTVSREDTVYHLGDVSFADRRRTYEILWRLNGQLFLVPGNHDRKREAMLMQSGRFGWSQLIAEIKHEKEKIVLCHFPMLTWNRAHYGSWHLHGHSHGNLKVKDGLRLDVGIDARPDMRPWSFEEVKEYMKAREFVAVDHHG